MLLAFLLVGLALVAYFDLSTHGTISDEYARRWSIQHFLAGKGITLWGLNPNLVFAALALVPGSLGLDPNTWRLVGLPFLLIAAIFLYLSARELGASRFWSGVAAVAFVCSPVTLSLATGVMTETAYLGLEAAGVYFCLRWIRRGTHRWWTVLAIGLLPLQRQQGIVIAVALTVVLLLAVPRRPLVRTDVVALVCAWLAGLAAVALTFWLHRSSTVSVGVASSYTKEFAVVLFIVAGLCPILGLLGIPLTAALVRRARADSKQSWAGKLTVPVAIIGLVFGVAVVMPHLQSIFPGDRVAATGVGPASLAKPELLPRPLLYVLELVTVASFVAILVWRRRDWSPSRLTPELWFLVLAAGFQFGLIIFEGRLFDRYYLPVLLPLLPMFVVWASGKEGDTRAARWFAVGACMVLLAYFGVGQQDFTAWSNARDNAADVAYAMAASPADVSGGWEEDAKYLWVPAADHPGEHLPQDVSPNPTIRLVTVDLSDPRPGFAYSSIASGKVIIVHVAPGP